MSLSVSEDNGIELMQPQDIDILSIGVSTAGVAEIRMAKELPERHIIATTIDERGLNDAKKYILEQGYAEQIELKLEDVSEKLPYEDESFDFIYARLVLHYLTKEKLATTLKELHRVLRAGKILYVVVRSAETKDAINAVKYDQDTGYSYYHHAGDTSTPLINRFFHSEESIGNYIVASGFKIDTISTYEERLYADFMRTVPAPHTDLLIEARAKKHEHTPS